MSERIVDLEPGSILERAAGLRRRAQGRSEAEDVPIIVPPMGGGAVSIIPQDIPGGPPDAGGRAPDLPLPPDGATITSRDSGSQLDHIRTAIMSLQLYAEGNHDD